MGRKRRAPRASRNRGKRLEPRKVAIQSNDVPFNLYAKRSIEHIVILIDRIHSVQYWYIGNSIIRVLCQFRDSNRIQARFILVTLCRPISLSLRRFRRFARGGGPVFSIHRVKWRIHPCVSLWFVCKKINK